MSALAESDPKMLSLFAISAIQNITEWKVPKSPAFRFYPSDFMASPTVQAMDLHEVGAYTLLLCTAWNAERHGYLPDDENLLRRWARMTKEQWAESRSLLLSRFPVVESGWRANPRMVEEAKRQQSFSESQSKKGAMGGRPRKNPELSNENPELFIDKPNESQDESPEKPSVFVSAFVSVSDTASEEQIQTQAANAPSVIPKTQKQNVSLPSREMLQQAGLKLEDYESYMAVRKAKKQAFVDENARNKWIAKWKGFYDEGKNTTAMFDLMISSGWIGPVEEKWTNRKIERRAMTVEEAEASWEKDFELMGMGKPHAADSTAD